MDKLGEDYVELGSDFDGLIVPDLIGDVTGVPRLFGALGYDQTLMQSSHAVWRAGLSAATCPHYLFSTRPILQSTACRCRAYRAL